MNDMLTLRTAGIIFGLVSLSLIWLVRFKLKRLRNFDWLIGTLLSITVIFLGIFPDALNSILEMFSFEKGGGQRIIGLLIFSNVILYFILFTSLSRNRNTEQLVDRLVRELAKKEFRKEIDKKNQNYPIYILIPAYNEAENIGVVLGRLPEKVCGLKTKTVVVIDGATDETEDVVRKLNQSAISYTINRGGGSALMAGYQVAFEDGADVIVTLDADGQHLPEEVPTLVQPILDGEADLVNGSRVLGYYEKDNQMRALGVVLFNWLISILMMTRITDSSNTFRALRASEYPKLNLMQRQFHSSELLIEALKKGLRVIEVPITIKPRLSGESKKGPTLAYAWGYTRAIITTWLR